MIQEGVAELTEEHYMYEDILTLIKCIYSIIQS